MWWRPVITYGTPWRLTLHAAALACGPALAAGGATATASTAVEASSGGRVMRISWGRKWGLGESLTGRRRAQEPGGIIPLTQGCISVRVLPNGTLPALQSGFL